MVFVVVVTRGSFSQNGVYETNVLRLELDWESKCRRGESNSKALAVVQVKVAWRVVGAEKMQWVKSFKTFCGGGLTRFSDNSFWRLRVMESSLRGVKEPLTEMGKDQKFSLGHGRCKGWNIKLAVGSVSWDSKESLWSIDMACYNSWYWWGFECSVS